MITRKTYPKLLVLLAALFSILPFLNSRVLRMAGDEKVYLSQAIEMARHGKWFIQTLADEPNYFKGPMHYVLVKIGLLVFGNQLIAGLWMNFALALLAAFAMMSLVSRKWNSAGVLTISIATVLNIGVVSHIFASQMEVEVFAFYTFAMVFLGKSFKSNLSETFEVRNFTLFWIFAGMAGWIKSPVHSVLIGVSGLLYLFLRGDLLRLAFTKEFWRSVFWGIGFGVLGYAPILLNDWHNFYNTYILREQFEKANNNRQWHYVVLPLFHFLLPWTAVFVFGFLSLLKGKVSSRLSVRRSYDAEFLKLGFSFALPTILFWSFWSYKGQNYNLPTLSALLLFGWACFRGEIPAFCYKITGLLGLALFFTVVGIFTRFWPMPSWWPVWMIVTSLAFLLLFSMFFLFSKSATSIAMGAAAFFITFGLLITPLGRREMIDIKQFVKEHPKANYFYYNIDRSIWNEWGLLQLALHREIQGIHKPEQLDAFIKTPEGLTDRVLFLNKKAELDQTIARLKEIAPTIHPQVTLALRWLTKGKTDAGENRFKTAWEKRSLSELEREFFILELK